MNRVIVAVLAAAFSTTACAGPFGLEFGSSLASLSKLKLKQVKPFIYATTTVPNGHPDFDDYRLVISPRHGLCSYTGWVSKIDTNSYGDRLREKFESLRDALTNKYGEPEVFDYLKSGSIWKERREFMMGLKLEERSLKAFWVSEKVSLPSNIGGINLRAYALSETSGMVAVQYSSPNEAECLKSIAQERDSAL